MNIDEDRILKEVRLFALNLTQFSETAQLDLFLACYADTPDFLAVSGDGVIRNLNDFKKICKDYYGNLKEQKLTTVHEKFHILDESTVLFCWSGNIDAYFKNGGTWKMQNYTVTYIFKKIDGVWKIIHSHESSLPPQIIKSE
jgi:ketosteroid isomerase-like protein